MAIIITALAFTSCQKETTEATAPELTPLELLRAHPQQSLFSEMLTKDGWGDQLQQAATNTVFAPVNAAIAQYLSSRGISRTEALPADELQQFLALHQLATPYAAVALPMGYVQSRYEHPIGTSRYPVTLFVQRANNVTTVQNARLTQPDLVQGRMIHGLEEAIALPGVLDHLSVNPDCSAFLAALKRSDLSANNFALLKKTGAVTLFVPTNFAFASFLLEKGYRSLDIVPQVELNKIVRTHLIESSNFRAAHLPNKLLKTTGGQVTISVDGNTMVVTDLAGRKAKIVQADVQSTNGVLHLIDRVLLP
jgi:uncharacterized surface protein with fasciclin (FAS1) repeats